MSSFKISQSAPLLESRVSTTLNKLKLELNPNDHKNVMEAVTIEHISIATLFKVARENELCGICPRNIIGECYNCELSHLINVNEYGTTAEHVAKWIWRASIHSKSVADIVRDVMLHLS
jgi:hypothetical protein